MKKKLDPELDALIWQTAESDDAEVIAQFELRYPHLRAQLATRRAMIEVIRKSRPTDVTPTRFTPSDVRSCVDWRRLALVPLAGLLLAGLGFGAYKITEALSKEAKSPVVSQPEVSSGEPSRVPGGPALSLGPKPPSLENVPDGTEPRPVGPAAELILVRISVRTTLLSALDTIARHGKVPIQVLPGVQNVPIELPSNDVSGDVVLPPGEMLAALERVAPIRVIDNGPDGFVILPEDRVVNVDPGASNSGASGGPLRSATGGTGN